MATEVVMPQLGESVIEGTISRWLKSEGDTIDEYEALLEVSSDKVDTEIPAPTSGTVLKIMAGEGDVVEAGTVLALIGEAEEEVGEETPATPEPAASPVREPQTVEAKSANGHDRQPRISPVVARIAAEHNVNVNDVDGSGRDGRVTKDDILAYVEDLEQQVVAQQQTATTPAPPPQTQTRKPTPTDHVHTPPPAGGRPGELVQLSRMRKLIADHMVQSKLKTAPHVTTVFEVDLHNVVAHRAANKQEMRDRGINLTYTAYFVQATAIALQRHPMVNSSWREDGIFLHSDINIGMAVAIDEGLIVPVLKNVDDLSLGGIARRVNDLAIRAREGNLSADEIQGGTFTITNHGVSGSLFATPIINQPQTAILGVGAINKRVVVLENDTIGIRPMAYLTLTFDHRVLDGAGADWFMVEIKNILEQWQA